MNKHDAWDIEKHPQTQIKLDILKKYLWAWAVIIGNHFRSAYFVDCFAGRGKYHRGEETDILAGSPLIGLETSLKVRKAKQKKGMDFDLNIVAVEANDDNLFSLKEFVNNANIDNKSNVEFYSTEFEKAIPAILLKISGMPAFFFIDPYGIKDISKEALDLIVSRSGSTEIFLNYMRMGVQRVSGHYKNIAHEDDKVRVRAIKTISHMNDLFGDASWVGKRDEELLKHFVKQVFSKNYKFVLNFSVPYPDRSGIIYNLIFATNYNCGEKVMKDIMTAKLFKGTLFEKCPFNVNWNVKC